jgi:hypothetical protein
MRMVALTIAFAALVAYGGEPKPPSDAHKQNPAHAAEQTQSTTGGTGTATNQPTFQAEKDGHSGAPPTYLSRLFDPENLPNIALVIVATLTGLAIAYQAREMKRATKEMQASTEIAKKTLALTVSKERPRIRVEPLTFTALAGPMQEIKYTVQVFGLTPAYIVESVTIAHLTGSKDDPRSEWEASDYIPLPISLNPVSTPPITLEAEVPLYGTTQDDLIAIFDGQKFLHFWGFVRYRDSFYDVFHKEHVTRFQYIWKVVRLFKFGSNQPQGVWIKHGTPEANYED